MHTPEPYQSRGWWGTTLAFVFGLFVLFGRGLKWVIETILALFAAGLFAAAAAGIAGVTLLSFPFLLFLWGWVAAGPLLPHSSLAGLLMTALGACGAALATMPWRPVQVLVAWLTSPLRRSGVEPPVWLTDASRSINAFVLLSGALVSLAHLSGELFGFDTYLVRVALFIGMMMVAGFVNLAERHRLASELFESAVFGVRFFRTTSFLLIIGSLTVGSYWSALFARVQFPVRMETRDVRLADGTNRPVHLLPTPSGAFFLIEDVFGPFAEERLLSGEDIRLGAGMVLDLPGYLEVPVAFDDGAVGWKIRKVWWKWYETRAENAPFEYSSLSDAWLIERLTPPVPPPPPVEPAPAPPPLSTASAAPRPIACADLPPEFRARHCRTADSKPSSK